MKILPRILFCRSFVLALPALAEVRSKCIRIEQGGRTAGPSAATGPKAG